MSVKLFVMISRPMQVVVVPLLVDILDDRHVLRPRVGVGGGRQGADDRGPLQVEGVALVGGPSQPRL